MYLPEPQKINYQPPPAGVPSQPPTQSPEQLPSEQYDHSLHLSLSIECAGDISIFSSFTIMELFNKLVNIFVKFLVVPTLFTVFGGTPLYH